MADLAGRIIRGEWSPGDSIGNEAALMDGQGVSRTTVREAVKILASKGLLEVRPRTGTRVLPPERWNVLDPDMLDWMFAGPLTTALMRHLHELRTIIEPAAAALAAERATDAERARICACVDRMDEAGEDTPAFVAADVEFHTTILEARAIHSSSPSRAGSERCCTPSSARPRATPTRSQAVGRGIGTSPTQFWRTTRPRPEPPPMSSSKAPGS